MGRPIPLTGLEILTRLHVVLGHPPLDQLLATLAKTQNMAQICAIFVGLLL